MPLAEVREENVARIAKYKGIPTPKATAAQREAGRKHGGRVSDSAMELELWNRLDHPRPIPPAQPRNQVEGFGETVIGLAKRGRDLAHKAVEVPPAAAYNQWRSFVRMERRNYGGDCSLESLYQEYYQAVAAYVELWQSIQDEVGRRYAEAEACEKQPGGAIAFTDRKPPM